MWRRLRSHTCNTRGIFQNVNSARGNTQQPFLCSSNNGDLIFDGGNGHKTMGRVFPGVAEIPDEWKLSIVIPIYMKSEWSN